MAVPSLPPLERAPLDLVGIRDQQKDELLEILDKANMRGNVALVIDRELSAQLGLIVEPAELKRAGVDKFYHLLPGPLETDCVNVVYIIRARQPIAKIVCDQILQHKRDVAAAATQTAPAPPRSTVSTVPPASPPPNRRYAVAMVPRLDFLCDHIFEEEGLYGEIQLYGFSMNFIPLDDDIVSLEMGHFISDVYFDHDYSSVNTIASALLRLERHCGAPPVRVFGIGPAAKLVHDSMCRLRSDRPSSTAVPLDIDRISTLFLFDRQVDWVTPMLTPLTYEGLVDEFLRIRCGVVDVEAKLAGLNEPAPAPAAPGAPPPQPVRRNVSVPLNSLDPLFRGLRDLHFSAVGPFLNSKARQLDDSYRGGRESISAPDVPLSALRDLVSRLGTIKAEHRSLTLHTNLAYEIINRVKEGGHASGSGSVGNGAASAEDGSFGAFALPPGDLFTARLECEQNCVAGVDNDATMEYMEDCLYRKDPLVKVLRLAILRSLTNGGIGKSFDIIRRDLLQVYGYEQIVLLDVLERAGMLVGKAPSTSLSAMFGTLRKSLGLIVDKATGDGTPAGAASPTDAAYVFNNYCPMSVRLIQKALAGGAWTPPAIDRNAAAVLSSAGVPLFCEKKDGAGVAGGATVAVFIGGVTFAEMSALRYLSRSGAAGLQRLLVITTKMINGTSVIESVMEML